MLRFVGCCGLLLGLLSAVPSLAVDDMARDAAALTRQLQDLDSRVIVLGTVRQPPLASMLSRHAEARLRTANRDDRAAWEKVKSAADWQQFREERLRALRKSLGEFPPVPQDLKVRVTGSIRGDGFRVDKLVYVTRPALVVTANLYRPARDAAPAQGSLPGIILCHSHQSTKHSAARQDMAMTWARAGCVVLVPDHLGHGERRQHPFGEGQHDYHFRYDAGLQLHLAGESLMGWLVWDLMRGVDVLLAQPGVDPQRLIMISEPAGGGDVAAVTAALDSRITCAMVQNFGGPQPETAFPLASDAEESFSFAGSGSWESTRNLRCSARDGFLPWSIVASLSPRRLIYFHEFYWDREQDPVWKRLQQVYRWHDRSDALVGLAGRGFVVGSAPENTHWLPENRELLYPVLERWFAISNPQKEYSRRLPESDLHCLTPEIARDLGARPLHQLIDDLARDRLTAARQARLSLDPDKLREQLRRDWSELLGNVTPKSPPVLLEAARQEQLGEIRIERIHLRTDPGIVVPVLLLLPPSRKEPSPLVIGIAQQGKQEFLKQRAAVIAALLRGGMAVCLLDVRGTGETSPGDDRGRRSGATSTSAGELMLGQSVLGGQLHDVRSVLNHLRTHRALDAHKVAMWGESFTPSHPPDVRYQLPHTASDRPASPEPMGGLLSLLTGLFEDDVQAIHVHRGLADFQAALSSPFCYLPHDAVVPAMLAKCEVLDLASGLAPRPIWLNGSVDAMNRAITDVELENLAKSLRAPNVLITPEKIDETAIAQWLLTKMRK